MPQAEFVEWVAFSRIEPFGDERADWRAALIASVIAEVNRHSTKRRRPFQPKDFLLKFEGGKRQTWQSQLQFVEMLNAAFGGEDKRTPSPSPAAGEGGEAGR